MRKAVLMIIAACLILSLALTSYAYTITDYNLYSDNSRIVCTDSGLYLVGWSGRDMYIQCAVPDDICADLTLGYNISTASVFGDTAYALCNDTANNQLIVYSYDIEYDYLDSFAVSNTALWTDIGFYCDGTGLYLPDYRSGNTINRYSLGGRLVSSYSFPSDISAVIPGYSAGFYVICANRLYRHSSDSYYQVGTASLSTPASFASDSIISDSRGRIFSTDNGLELLFTAETGYDYSLSCVCGGYIYCADGSTVNRYNYDGEIEAYIELDDNVSALYACGSMIYAVSGCDLVSAVRTSEFRAIQKPTEAAKPINAEPITSEEYYVDYVNYRISGIESPTTFAQFKKNMSYEGYKAVLYRNGKKITGGNVGTAMTVRFDGEDSYIFELVVRGDITGEGNVNSRDVGELMDYMLDYLSFDGAYYDAADVSGDGLVDIMDLAILHRMK